VKEASEPGDLYLNGISQKIVGSLFFQKTNLKNVTVLYFSAL